MINKEALRKFSKELKKVAVQPTPTHLPIPQEMSYTQRPYIPKWTPAEWRYHGLNVATEAAPMALAGAAGTAGAGIGAAGGLGLAMLTGPFAPAVSTVTVPLGAAIGAGLFAAPAYAAGSEAKRRFMNQYYNDLAGKQLGNETIVDPEYGSEELDNQWSANRRAYRDFVIGGGAGAAAELGVMALKPIVKPALQNVGQEAIGIGAMKVPLRDAIKTVGEKGAHTLADKAMHGIVSPHDTSIGENNQNVNSRPAVEVISSKPKSIPPAQPPAQSPTIVDPPPQPSPVTSRSLRPKARQNKTYSIKLSKRDIIFN